MNDNQVTNNSENSNKNGMDVGELNYNIEGFEVKPNQTFSIMKDIIEKNVEFVDKSNVVFISGCNLIVHDLDKKTSKFLIRKCPGYTITSMSVGYKSYSDDKKNDPYICLGEYNPNTKISQISTISVRNPDVQNILTYKQARGEKDKTGKSGKVNFNSTREEMLLVDWKISFAKILNSSSYCIGIGKKENHGMMQSKVSFWKYTQEKFISEVIIHENLNSCSYNPQNPLELVICGKGYLRLWNVFINEGSLKEHPQRYLRGKQEKEHNFIKAEFFQNKSFMFIVGTTENVFYIIEGFHVVYDFDASYSSENIADMYINNILRNQENEEGDDIMIENNSKKKKNQNETEEEYFNFANNSSNNTNSENIDSQSLQLNKASNESGDSEKNDMNKSLQSNLDAKNTVENNPLRSFFLINNSIILMGFQKSSITYFYKLEKDFKNKKEREANGITSKDGDEKKSSIDDVKILRLATNVRSIINIMSNPDRSQIMFMVEVISDDQLLKKGSNKESFNTISNASTSLALYLFTRIGSKLIFDKEVFKEYFFPNSIRSFDFSEKKKMIFTITNNNWLRCFDYNLCQFSIKHYFEFGDTPTMVTVSPNNNLFGVCFTRKFIIYALFREKIKPFCEFEIINPYAKFTDKGDYIAIAGESRVNKNYCIYFIDTFYFNTVYIIENIPKINKITFIDEDRYIFALLENSFILGWTIRLDLMTMSLMSRLKDYEKSIESYYFRLSFKHPAKINDYADFDYDPKHELLIVTYKTSNRISVFKKKNILLGHIEMNKKPLRIKIVKELKCLLVGFEDGSLKIFRWPFKEEADNGDKIDVVENNALVRESLFTGGNYNDPNNMTNQQSKIVNKVVEKGIVYHENKQVLFEINLHSKDLNNLLFTKNMKTVITSSIDGSLILSNLLILTSTDVNLTSNTNNNTTSFYRSPNLVLKEFDHFNEWGSKLKPSIEEVVRLCDVFEYRIEDIKKKDKKVEILDDNIQIMKMNNEKKKEELEEKHVSEVTNLEIQKTEALTVEHEKESKLRSDLNNLSSNIEEELEKRFKDHEKEKERLTNKYDEKLQLYRNEIERLETELKELHESIESRFKTIISSQTDNFQSIFDVYNKQYQEMKLKIDSSLQVLIKSSAEYDEAVDTIIKQYEKMVEDMDSRLSETLDKNKSDMKDLKKTLEVEKVKENEFKNNLDQRVQESDKIIQKNAEVKKQIIDTTQRTITFQEQLLETEKNLQKIARKLKELDTKNKHLEQIRFVLEHRMTSLDKEKAPLEGQCIFLEKKKNNLQEEFNRLILAINLKNQFLENKQSQLRACLIQNFEINDQTLYIKKKLKHLQNEIRAFIFTHGEGAETNRKVSIQESKATFVAMKLRQFYDKYFSNNIEHELLNYQFYLTKLQEETEKMSIANNFDLIMRDKGEEKLISEKSKLADIELQKEKGFRRMENENTILIAECNRLRKNLHEVYMHVVDIEQKFEDLTKINPGLNKVEIVYQIKEFIKQTHNKIRGNFQEGVENLENVGMHPVANIGKKPEGGFSYNSMIMKQGPERNYPFGNDILKSVNDHNENIISQNLNLDNLKQQVRSAIDQDKSAYENFLKLPEIRKTSNITSKRESEKNVSTSGLNNEADVKFLPAINDEK